MPIPWLALEPVRFPPVNQALRQPDGLLAAGGSLDSDWLICAYQHGIFPWYEAGQPILWWSPDPRMVLFVDQLHVSRSLARFSRQTAMELSYDRNFDAVIQACAEARKGSGGTWITNEMSLAYRQLHRQGVAHSVEVWDDGELVGGLYGVALGRLFFGESMFSRKTNASKLALVFLVDLLRQWNYLLIDCQLATRHLASLGAVEIPRRKFVDYLESYVGDRRDSDGWK